MCSRDGLFSAESRKWTQFGLCLNVSSFRITSWSLLATRLLCSFSSYSYLRMFSHHICLVLAADPPHYLILPISLNSLDLAGVRLLSPRDSWILPKRCRCRWYQCRWCYQTQVVVRRGPWSILCFVSWWSVVEPSWEDWGSSIWGCLLLFWVRSRTLIVLWMMYV